MVQEVDLNIVRGPEGQVSSWLTEGKLTDKFSARITHLFLEDIDTRIIWGRSSAVLSMLHTVEGFDQ